eukprot:3168134-Rhodomonas_salina.1
MKLNEKDEELLSLRQPPKSACTSTPHNRTNISEECVFKMIRCGKAGVERSSEVQSCLLVEGCEECASVQVARTLSPRPLLHTQPLTGQSSLSQCLHGTAHSAKDLTWK